MRRNQSSGASGQLDPRFGRGVHRQVYRLPFSKNPLCTAFQVEYWKDFLLDFDTVS